VTVRLEEHMRKYSDPQTPYEQYIHHVWKTWRGYPFLTRMHFTPFDEVHEGDIKGTAYSPCRKITAGDLGLA
jgi:hypothetical protein